MNGCPPFIFCARILFRKTFICSAGNLPAKSAPGSTPVILPSLNEVEGKVKNVSPRYP